MIIRFCIATGRIKVLQRFYSSNIKVLGIESSCDDTAAAVIDDSRTILGESNFSQSRLHLEFGGVVPHVAHDLHAKYVGNVVEASMKQSHLEFKDLDAIAVTVKPGLKMSLEAGLTYAKYLCTSHRKPMIPIHHMEAHALTARLTENVNFPFLVFLLSGGHCILGLVKSVEKYYTLSKLMSKSPGCTLDKVARRAKLINLKKFRGLVGGAAIEAAALEGDPESITFAYTILQNKNCSFCFGGILSTALQYIEKQEIKNNNQPDEVIENINDFCASFQWAVTRHLCQRLQVAIEYIEKKKLLGENEKCLVVSGGVASNQFIKNALKFVCDHFGYRLVVPPPKLCTDNGVMIAWNGVERLRENLPVVHPDNLDSVIFQPKCPLGEDISTDVEEVVQGMMIKYIKLRNIIQAGDKKEIIQLGQ